MTRAHRIDRALAHAMRAECQRLAAMSDDDLEAHIEEMAAQMGFASAEEADTNLAAQMDFSHIDDVSDTALNSYIEARWR